MTHGLLLINLGTPDAPTVTSVRKYLKEFLADPRVITLAAPLRYLFLYALILPFRPQRSALAYQAIWTKEGSPLLTHGHRLVEKLQHYLGDNYHVVLGMRYGKPSLYDALMQLSHCDSLTILPLYPQYSSAATCSCVEKTLSLLKTTVTVPQLHLIRDFYQHPGFIIPQSEQIKPYLATHDYLLLSFHGVPLNQLKPTHCKTLCVGNCPQPRTSNATCYRAQCFATSQAIATQLNLNSDQYGVVFQSRLGHIEWIKPYLETTLPELATKKIKRLAISCPSFVTDCLETLEEIGIRANRQWQTLGGEQLTLIPALNENDAWIKGILEICDIKLPSYTK
ncbi:MAG: ferrochelatase [Legionellales bacterium RIFCSPHIGHO2_12_FULL_42_9]|nr:MAG: ferrochelatase [Legionellales bacterium RIFCSPHIGHO2_12_FULL_42_9]